MSHYESQGCTWEEGAVPMCTYCEENVAVWETAHNGIHLCDSDDCHLAYTRDQCWPIELVDDDDEEEVN